MKKFILLFGFIGLMSFGASAQKFGHTDAQNLLLNLPAFAEANASFEASRMEFQKEMMSMQEQLQTKAAEYQAKAETWPAAIRESKERDYSNLEQGIQEFNATAEADLSSIRESLFAPLMKLISEACEAVGAEHGFTYIFDIGTGATVYNGGEDVTDLVRTKLGM